MPQSPILETERLILRPMQMTDAEAHYKYINDWEVARFLSSQFPWPFPDDGSQKFLAKSLAPDVKSYYWTITVKTRAELSDEMIGAIELRPHENTSQRGFWLGRPFHNQGIMTEATIAVNDFWFDELQKPYLNMSNAQTNDASRRIKEKTGARLLEVIDSSFLDPELKKEEIWEITAEEWRRYRSGNLKLL